MINIAEENGLNSLTFPPHCSHRLQPLDICLFGPFKTFYYRFCDSWMMSNSGQLISIYEVAELAGSAFVKAFNPENITSAFKISGIFPYNSDIFTDDMFLPASVTDILSSNVDNNQQIVNSNTLPAAHSSSNLIDEEVLNEIMPHPKTNKTI